MPNQYFATNRKVGDGSTTVWEFSFAGARPDANNGTEPYLEPSDVGVALVSFDSEGRELRTPVNHTLIAPAQVEVTPAIANGQDFVIFRQTESELPVTDFTDFASISEQDLDNSTRQTLFTVQELQDRVTDANDNSIRATGTANYAAQVAEEAEDVADNAAAIAAAANNTAAQAQSEAAAAVSTANAASDTANTANNTANTALSAASDAQNAVADAVSTANAANAAASSAVTTANSATATANSASTTAANAQSVASSAATLADTADTNATAALNAATAAVDTANTADGKADQALEAAGLVVNFQEQLDQIESAVADLTGAEVGALSRNDDNLSKLTDFAAARTNLDVYSKAEVDASQQAQDSTLADHGTRITAAEDTLPNKADKSTLVTAGDGLTGGGSLGGNLSLSVDASVARTTTQVIAGNGLVGGGSLADDRTVTLGTPSGLSGNTTNAATADSHTHSIDATASRTDSTSGRLLLASGMNSHRTSGDHDSRYPTLSLFNERHQIYEGSVSGQRIMRTVPERMVWFQVHKSVDQTVINSSNHTKITWTSLTGGRDDPNTFFYYPAAWWNTSLNRFVAPVPGLYEFKANLIRGVNPSRRSPIDARFAVNGVVLETSGPAAYGTAALRDENNNVMSGVHLDFTTARLEGIIQLNAGDYVEIFNSPVTDGLGGVIYFGGSTNRHSWFMGRLL